MDPIARARAAWARGREETWSATPMRAHELLVTEALRIETVDRSLAALMLADAALAASSATESARAMKTAERAMELGRVAAAQQRTSWSCRGRGTAARLIPPLRRTRPVADGPTADTLPR